MKSFFTRCSRFAAFLLVLAVLSCSDDTSSPVPEPDNLTRETANTTSGTIGPAGGTLQTTAEDGTVYTLTVPADAIATGRTITMTPITAIDGYPLAGGVAGGVELQPSGTVFTAPVTLEIETARTPDAGSVPVAILFSGNGTSFEPSFAGSSTGTYTVPMTHFSGGTVGFATAQELAQIIQQQGATCLLAALGVAFTTPPDVAAVHAIYLACFSSEVLPAIEQASNDVQLAGAIGGFIMWKTTTRAAIGEQIFTTFDDLAETAQAHDALALKLKQAIDRNNQRCEAQESLASLANVLFWQTQASRFGLDSVARLLDRNTVLRGLCARPVVDTIVIPGDLQVGFPRSLDIQFGLLFNGQTASQGVPFQVTLAGDGIDIQNPTGFTDGQGAYTSVITATRDGDLFVTATGCLVYPGTQTVSDVCVEETGQSEGTDVSGTWTGTVVTTGAPAPACAIINQNQNAISGTIHQFGGTATVLATLSGSQLLGVTIEGFFGEADCITTGSGTVNGNIITMTVVPMAPCNSNLSLTYTFTRGGTCP